MKDGWNVQENTALPAQMSGSGPLRPLRPLRPLPPPSSAPLPAGARVSDEVLREATGLVTSSVAYTVLSMGAGWKGGRTDGWVVDGWLMGGWWMDGWVGGEWVRVTAYESAWCRGRNAGLGVMGT